MVSRALVLLGVSYLVEYGDRTVRQIDLSGLRVDVADIEQLSRAQTMSEVPVHVRSDVVELAEQASEGDMTIIV